MADNVTLPGTGVQVRTIANGAIETQVMKLDFGGESGENLVTPTSGLPTITFDGLNNPINSLSQGVGQNGLLSAQGATNFYFSVGNSSVTQLASGASFIGSVESLLAAPAVSLLISSDQPGTLILNQWEDAAGAILVNQWTYPVSGIKGVGISQIVNGNYVSVTFINAGAATTKFVLNVAYGTIVPSTQLGNTPTAITEIAGVAIPFGSGVPVVLSGTPTVSNATITAAQTSDAPLFQAITGDPNGDYANVDFMAALFDNSLGYTASVNVTNPLPTDSSSANSGALSADCKGYTVLSGQTIIIDTAGYQSMSLHCIAGTLSITQSNILTNSSFAGFNNVLLSSTGTYGQSILGGQIGSLSCTLRYVKLIMPLVAGNFAQVYLRSNPISPSLVISGQAMNINNIAGSNASNAVIGSLAVNGAVAEGSAANNYPVSVGGMVRTSALTALNNAAMSKHTMSSGGALITAPHAVPDVRWSATSGTTALATTTSTSLNTAGAAGIRNYCTDVQLFNTSATVGSTVSILDGSTVLWTGYLPPMTAALQLVPVIICFDGSPLRGTAATVMNIQLGTTAASVYYNVQGFQAP